MKSPNVTIKKIDTQDTMNVNVVSQFTTPPKILPKTLLIPSTMTNTNGMMVRHLTKDGVLYGSRYADT